MNLILCTGSFDPAQGGPSVSVSRLGAELARVGVTVGLWAQDGSPIRNATLTGPPLLFRGSRRVRGSLLDYGMGGGVIVYMMIYGVILSVLTNSDRPLFGGRQMVVTSRRAHGTADGVSHRWALYLGCCRCQRDRRVNVSDLVLSFSDRVLRPLSRPKYPVGLAIRSLRAPSTESRQ